MGKRRGRGEGGLFQRADGKWIAKVSAGFGKDGRRKVVRRYAVSKREALKLLEELKLKHVAGHLVSSSPVTVSQLLTIWYRDVKADQVERHTLNGYQTITGSHIDPILGSSVVQKLTPNSIFAWLRTLSEAKVGKPSTSRALTLLRQALDHAVVLGLISANPAQKIKGPKISRKTRLTLGYEEIRRYFSLVEDDRLGTIAVLAIATTMREGELLGLQWSDVDWEAKAIFARHALKRGKESDKAGEHFNGYYLGTISKSSASRRRIDLPDFAMKALEIHRKRMMAEGHGSKYVFCTMSGTPVNPSNLRNRFHYPIVARLQLEDAGMSKATITDALGPSVTARTLKTLGLKVITFHDLRHSAATLMLSLGVHPKVAQERLGHSTYKMTMDLYSHAIASMQKEAADKINDRFQ